MLVQGTWTSHLGINTIDNQKPKRNGRKSTQPKTWAVLPSPTEWSTNGAARLLCGVILLLDKHHLEILFVVDIALQDTGALAVAAYRRLVV